MGRTDSLVFTVLGKRRVQKGKYKSVRDGSVSSESRGLQSVVVHVFSLPDEKYVGSHEVKVGKNLPEKIEANSGLSDIKGNVSVWLNKQY